jgi:hypothetical protein
MFGLTRARPVPLATPDAERWCGHESGDDLGVDRRFVFGTSGMCPLWSAEPINVPSRDVKLNGIGGEPWYTNYPVSGKLARLDEFHTWLYAGQKLGYAGLVTADARTTTRQSSRTSRNSFANVPGRRRTQSTSTTCACGCGAGSARCWRSIGATGSSRSFSPAVRRSRGNLMLAVEFGTGQVFLTILYFFLLFILIWLVLSVFTDLFR